MDVLARMLRCNQSLLLTSLHTSLILHQSLHCVLLSDIVSTMPARWRSIELPLTLLAVETYNKETEFVDLLLTVVACVMRIDFVDLLQQPRTLLENMPCYVDDKWVWDSCLLLLLNVSAGKATLFVVVHQDISLNHLETPSVAMLQLFAWPLINVTHLHQPKALLNKVLVLLELLLVFLYTTSISFPPRTTSLLQLRPPSLTFVLYLIELPLRQPNIQFKAKDTATIDAPLAFPVPATPCILLSNLLVLNHAAKTVSRDFLELESLFIVDASLRIRNPLQDHLSKPRCLQHDCQDHSLHLFKTTSLPIQQMIHSSNSPAHQFLVLLDVHQEQLSSTTRTMFLAETLLDDKEWECSVKLVKLTLQFLVRLDLGQPKTITHIGTLAETRHGNKYL